MMLINVGDLLELAVEEREFYTTFNHDIITHKGDIFVVIEYDGERNYTLLYQKGGVYLPEFDIQLLNQLFDRID